MNVLKCTVGFWARCNELLGGGLIAPTWVSELGVSTRTDERHHECAIKKKRPRSIQFFLISRSDA
jgi:hypothetical protein